MPILVVCAVWSTSVSASLVLELGVSGQVERPQEITASVGEIISFDVLLSQTGDEDRLTTDGLAVFGLRATIVGDGLQFTSFGVNEPDFFDISSKSEIVGPREILLVGESFSDRLGDSLLLGILGVRVTGPGSASVVLGPTGTVGADDFLLGGATAEPSIDAAIFSVDPIASPNDRSREFSLQVTAVPEPCSCAVLAVVSAATCAYRRRKRSVKWGHV